MLEVGARRRIGAVIGLAAALLALGGGAAQARPWKYTCDDKFVEINPTTHQVMQGGTISATGPTQNAAARRAFNACQAHHYQNCRFDACHVG